MSKNIPLLLTPTQLRHYESVKWLLSTGNVATGRSHLMAFVFLEQAFTKKGQWVYTFDHHPHLNSHRRMLSLLGSIFENHFDTDIYELRVLHEPNRIMVISKKVNNDVE